MIIFSLNDSEKYDRSDGRQVHILLKEKLGKSYDGITLFFSKGPDGHLSKHCHSNTDEIIVFPTGGCLEVNNKKYDFNEWDCVLLEPGDVHGYDGESIGQTIHFAILLTDKKDRKNI
jgi:quercetin dioxygenase-like cupin family protein